MKRITNAIESLQETMADYGVYVLFIEFTEPHRVDTILKNENEIVDIMGDLPISLNGTYINRRP